MAYEEMAKTIVDTVGGKSNIESITHCVTRLRFILKDDSIPDDKKIKAIPKVMGVMRAGGQYQVIVGNIFNDAFDAVENILDGVPTVQVSEEEIKEAKKQDESLAAKFSQAKSKNQANWFNKMSRAMVQMIYPIIPTMAAVGIMKGLMTILVFFGVLNVKSGTYIILTAANDGFLYFLPIIIAFSVAKSIKANPYIGATIGAALVLPAIVTAMSGKAGLTFLGLPVVATTYGNSLFPVMISTLIAGKFEHILKKWIPDFLELIRNMIVLIVMIPFTFLIVGPIFTVISKGLAAGTMGIFNFAPLLAAVLFGAFWQVMVLLGLHYAFIPIITDIVLRMGSEGNGLAPILGAGVWALAGAMLGFALKAKNKGLRATSFAAFVSAILGVTEPSIFGVALPYRRPFICSMIAGGIGGLIYPLMHVLQFYPAVAGGVLGFGSSMNPNGNPQSLIGYFVAFFVTIILSAVLTYLTTTDEVINRVEA